MKNEVAKIDQSPTPTSLMQLAIQKGVDTVQLKELMDLQERWEAKEAKKKFLDALSKFQTLVPALKKTKTAKIATKTGGSYSYKYADLGGITAAIKKPLNTCGLSYRWEFEDNGAKMKVTCYISHKEGHTEHSSMEAGLDNSGAKNDIQQKGSTQTYLQRYTLIGALGLSTADEDNDGKLHATTKEQKAPEKELSEQEIMDQWMQAVDGCKRKIELTNLYLQNRATVEANPKVQAIFKAREAVLKETEVNGSHSKVSMP